MKQYETKTITPKNIDHDFEIRVKVNSITNEHEWYFLDKDEKLIVGEDGKVPIDIVFKALLAMNSITHYILSMISANKKEKEINHA